MLTSRKETEDDGFTAPNHKQMHHYKSKTPFEFTDNFLFISQDEGSRENLKQPCK